MSFKVYRHTSQVPECQSGSVVAVGNFDGVHKGHQKLIQHTIDEAKRLGVPSVVLTFEPHPRKLFMGDAFEGRVSPFSCKASLLREMGVDVVYTLRFTKEYAGTEAELFIEEILLKVLSAKHVVVGEDFCFGKKRLGDVNLLKKYGESHGFSVEAFGEVQHGNGERYASSLVRKALGAGDVEEAYELLGRFFSVRTDLFEDQNCNLRGGISKYCALKTGVYFVKLSYADGKHAGEHVGVLPLSVKGGQVIIPPMKDIPDIAEGRYKIEFMKKLA